MEPSISHPPDPAPDEVRLWGIPDRADWSGALRLRARARTWPVKLLSWLPVIVCLGLVAKTATDQPEVAFLILVVIVALWLRRRKFRSMALDRIMLKAARSGGCPHWCFAPQGIWLQSGPNEFFFEWQTLDKVVADDELLILINNRFSIECVPVRFFKTPGDLTSILDLARAADLPVTDYRKTRSGN
ncbi:MAG: YcxB family protein [Luteolibacter sp.]